MAVQIVERKRHLNTLAELLTNLGAELRRSTAQEQSPAFEDGELTEMLASVAVGVLEASVRVALRCGASPRIIVAKINSELSRRDS